MLNVLREHFGHFFDGQDVIDHAGARSHCGACRRLAPSPVLDHDHAAGRLDLADAQRAVGPRPGKDDADAALLLIFSQ